jgi:hypothetical protein
MVFKKKDEEIVEEEIVEEGLVKPEETKSTKNSKAPDPDAATLKKAQAKMDKGNPNKKRTHITLIDKNGVPYQTYRFE